MKTESKEKRLVINLLAIVVILTSVMIAVRTSSKQTSSRQQESVLAINLPDFKRMKVIDVQETGSKVRVGLLVIPDREEADFVTDVLSAYEWGLKHFNPIKCGSGYPPDLCQVGIVEVWILNEDEATIPNTEGLLVHDYLVPVVFALDQIQTEALLNEKEKIKTILELVQFHQSVATTTQGSGGGVATTEVKTTFRWFKDMQ